MESPESLLERIIRDTIHDNLRGIVRYEKPVKSREERRKERARRLVTRAVKAGKLERPKRCEHCAEARRLNAHHEDYSRPLAVAWLCQNCHSARHVELRKKVNRPQGLSGGALSMISGTCANSYVRHSA